MALNLAGSFPSARPMFESLTDRLTRSFSFLRNKKELTEENIDEGLKEVRTALLEADVQFQLARDFTARVKERALGEGRLKGRRSVRPVRARGAR